MKHTPGPWTIDYEDGHYCRQVMTVRASNTSDLMGDYRGSIVCDFSSSHGGRTHALDEAEANARLIAAAPDLLYSLEQCVARLDCEICGHNYRCSFNCEPEEYCDTCKVREGARALIAALENE